MPAVNDVVSESVANIGQEPTEVLGKMLGFSWDFVIGWIDAEEEPY